MSEGRVHAPELLAGVARQRYAAELLAERYPNPGHELVGQISDRIRLAAELGTVDMNPERGIEREPDPAAMNDDDRNRFASLRAAHSTHLGHSLEGRKPTE